MNLATQIIFWVPYLGTSLVLVILLYFFIIDKKRFNSFLKLALGLIIGLFFLTWLGQILLLYLAIKTTPFSQVLLQGFNSFFVQKSFDVSKSYLITVAATIILFLLGIIIIKFQKKEYLEDFMPKILIMMGLSLNFVNIIPALFLAFLLALFFQFCLALSKKPKERLSIAPFLILATFLIHILMIFPFYSNFLGILHLL